MPLVAVQDFPHTCTQKVFRLSRNSAEKSLTWPVELGEQL